MMTSLRFTISPLLLVAMLALPVAMAEEKTGFGSNWEPRPLVNTTPGAPTVTAITPVQAPAPDKADAQKIEAMLEPVEPFIAGVEENLGITLAETKPLRLERLNHIQDILFGERIYDDAGDLLARLAEIFPQEAAEAQATLQARLRETVQNPGFDPSDFEKQKASAEEEKTKRRNKKSRRKHDKDPDFGPVATRTLTPSTFANPSYSAPATTYPGTTYQGQGYGQQQQQAYNDDYARRSERGETLKSLGRGLMNLAMIGGSLAGAYYLNRQMGDGNVYNTPYGYSGYPQYGSPYGYGYSPYAYNMQPGFSPYTSPYAMGLSPRGMYTTNGAITGNRTYRTTSPYAYGNAPYYGYPYGGYNSGLGSLLNSLF